MRRCGYTVDDEPIESSVNIASEIIAGIGESSSSDLREAVILTIVPNILKPSRAEFGQPVKKSEKFRSAHRPSNHANVESRWVSAAFYRKDIDGTALTTMINQIDNLSL